MTNAKKLTMKKEIIESLKEAKLEFESKSFLDYLLKGGYELVARNIIYDNIQGKERYGKEERVKGTNKVADLVLYPELSIADFGHNGTWQTQTTNTGLVNKMKRDINKYVNLGCIPAVYTVGFLTDIRVINIELRRRVRGYVDKKVSLTRETADKRINVVLNELSRIELKAGNAFEYRKYTNINDGFVVDIYVFVLGPYIREV